MNLLATETKRLAWRRFTWVTVAGVAAATVALVALTYPPPAPGTGYRPGTLSPITIDSAFYLGSLVAAFGALMIGASAIGAEHASGSLSQWLTYVPDRLSVYTSKLVPVAGLSALLGTVTVLGAAGFAVCLTVGYDRGWQVRLDVPAVTLRCVLFVAAAGVLGFALAALTGRTAAAPIAVGAWLTLSLLLSVVDAATWLRLLSAEWLLEAWHSGEATLGGYPVSHRVTLGWPTAGLVMAGVTAAVVTASCLRFNRQDLA